MMHLVCREGSYHGKTDEPLQEMKADVTEVMEWQHEEHDDEVKLLR